MRNFGSAAGVVFHLCVSNLCVRVCKGRGGRGVLEHSEIRECAACYMASGLKSVPWVKFTGLAIMRVNNPALSESLLPVSGSTQHASLENKDTTLSHLQSIIYIQFEALLSPPHTHPLIGLSLTSVFTCVLSSFFPPSGSDQCRSALPFTLN